MNILIEKSFFNSIFTFSYSNHFYPQYNFYTGRARLFNRRELNLLLWRFHFTLEFPIWKKGD